MIRKLLLLFSFVALSTLVFAQTGSVKGFIYDKATGEPILFTPVALIGTGFAVSTDVNGFYAITKIPPGNYRLIATATGYDSASVAIIIEKDKVISKQLYLVKTTVNLQEVDVSAEKQQKKTEVQTSVTKITPREIKIMPAVGGEPDLAQYLQILPGIVFSGDQGGQLYIRGGTPVQNKVLLDGMTIYNPFHSIGLFSVFDTDIMKNADVYTGGFGAEYGDRISSVMDITTRDGNKKRLSGKASLSTFNSKLLLEGPLKKQKVDGGASSTFVLSYKNSYLDQTSKNLYSYVNNGNGLPFSFEDLYGKVSFNGEGGSKFSVFGFDFTDAANFQDIAEIDWKSNGVGTNFVIVPKGSNTLMDGGFAYSKYKINQQEADDKPRSSSINGFNLNMNFTSFINRDEFRFGMEVLGFRTEYETYTVSDVKREQIENTTEFGTYFKYRISRDKFVLDPGLRIQYYASLAEFSLEPRMGAKYNVSDKIRLKAAGGFYSQNLMSAASDRDVVNLFYGFLSGPENLPEEFRGEEVNTRLQKARDLIAGVEWDITNHLEVNVEVYHKWFTQVTNINRDKIYPDNGQFEDQPDALVKDYIVEDGYSRGIDFVIKYDYKRFYVWSVYSLGYVRRRDEFREYAPFFDRRHNINMLVSYTFGKKLDWEMNVRWNYGSGFPFTQTAGFFELQTFGNGLGTDPTTVNGDLGIDYGEINQGRLPDYHRLDFSIKKSFAIGKNSILEANASVINVYDRENIFYFDRVRYQRINQLPVLPALGVNMTF
jgi:hypothetical protein